MERKILDIGSNKLLIEISRYFDNNRICIFCHIDNAKEVFMITANSFDYFKVKDNQNCVLINKDLVGYGILAKMHEVGIIEKRMKTKNIMGKPFFVAEINFKTLAEYDPNGMQNFLKLHPEIELNSIKNKDGQMYKKDFER